MKPFFSFWDFLLFTIIIFFVICFVVLINFTLKFNKRKQRIYTAVFLVIIVCSYIYIKPTYSNIYTEIYESTIKKGLLSEDTNAFNVDERLFYNFNVTKVGELLGEKSGFVFSAKYKNEGKEYSISLKYSDDKKVTFWMFDEQNQRTSDIAIYKEFNKVLIEWFKKEYISRFSIDNLGNVKITY